MEYNKDEAVRAKEIAEKKLLERDIIGAKKFALKAQSLFPKLDGLAQFLEIINVYIAHEKKINGEEDYYGILGVDPFADEEVLKKRYKRMALSLHPDKNKSTGADGAFKILSEAWSVLSNNDKRIVYNLKLNIKASTQAGSFNSTNARYTTTTSNPQRVPKPWTPMTANSQQYTSMPHYSRSATFGNPTTARFVGSQCKLTPFHSGNPTPGTSAKHKVAANLHCDPTPHQPICPTSETSRYHIPNYQKITTSTEFFSIPPCLRNPAPPTCNQHSTTRNPQLIPKYPTTPSPAIATQYKPAPGPHFHNQCTPVRNQMTYISHQSRIETFWTSCNRCRIKHEYQKIYLNQNLLCPCCRQPFLAVEMPAPNINHRSSCPSPFSHQ